jgi:hypothetical protein
MMKKNELYKRNTTFITSRTYKYFGDSAMPLPCPVDKSNIHERYELRRQYKLSPVPIAVVPVIAVDTDPHIDVRIRIKSVDVRPTDYAAGVANSLISQSMHAIDWESDKWSFIANEDGEMSITWRNGKKRLTIEIPADSSNEPFVYWTTGHYRGIVKNVNEISLAQQLALLSNT